MSYNVVDTNIFLLDANNLVTLGQDGSVVVVPETVLDEIDSKKSGHSEIAYQAREFGRLLARAKDVSITSIEDLVINEVLLNDVTIQIVSSKTYPNYSDTAENIINDRKIIEIAVQYQNIGNGPITFVTNDIACKHRAKSLGLKVYELRDVEETEFQFIKELDVPYDLFTNLKDAPITLIDPEHKTENYNYKFTSYETTNQVKLAYISPTGLIKIIGKETEKEIGSQALPPLNAEQKMLSRAILDTTLDIIICEAKSGSGKTATALSNAMKLVKTNSPYDSIIYMRASVNDVDDIEEVGFLPGLEEKFNRYYKPLMDTLDVISRKKNNSSKLKGKELEDKIASDSEEILTKYNITAMTMHDMRGRTFENCIVIWDEAQNNSKPSAQKVLTRMGKNCKVIILGSNRQIDNPYITKYTNGLSVIQQDCTVKSDNVSKFAINLNKVVRSDLAEWAENLFEGK